MIQEQEKIAVVIARARERLKRVLVPLQNFAMVAGDRAREKQLLALAEQAAEVMGLLYEIDNEPNADRSWMSAQLTTVMEGLRALLTSAQVCISDSPEIEPLVSDIAACLAAVFPLASSFNYLSESSGTDRPKPEPAAPRAQRVKNRLQLVMEPSDPPPERTSEPPESIPLVRHRKPPKIEPVYETQFENEARETFSVAGTAMVDEVHHLRPDDPADEQPANSALAPRISESDSTEPQSVAASDQPPADSEQTPPSSTVDSSETPSRRKAERVELEAQIGFVSETHFYTGLTMDISTGGLFLATYQLLPVGTEVNLSLMLPGGFPVQTVGVVRWIRDTAGSEDNAVPGMGIEFVSLSPEVREQIERFCRLRAPLYFDM